MVLYTPHYSVILHVLKFENHRGKPKQGTKQKLKCSTHSINFPLRALCGS